MFKKIQEYLFGKWEVHKTGVLTREFRGPNGFMSKDYNYTVYKNSKTGKEKGYIHLTYEDVRFNPKSIIME